MSGPQSIKEAQRGLQNRKKQIHARNQMIRKLTEERDRYLTALREIRVRTDKADIQTIIEGVLPSLSRQRAQATGDSSDLEKES